ncbi:formin-binding protein 4 [Aplysia californica]|uniref:Formin-binding protein 4 n=1 Tax=Aplysia californica TaxID=6500 RepID=A0ABM0JXJ7_APLCA|nr:formin-binding protein 4 [Aplysia californica]
MSRRGGKRRQIVQLDGSNTSKLHRYGYSKGLHSGKAEPPRLVGDYADSDSDESDDNQAAASTERTVSPGPTPEDGPDTDQGQTVGEEAPPGGDMDDELRNFLSEIEAIPMPEEGSLPQPAPISTGTSSEKTWELKAFQEMEKSHEEREATPPPKEETSTISATRKANPSKGYSMFVKGEPEFVSSPSRDVAEATAESGKIEDKLAGDQEGELNEEEIPEEPVSLWQMVQDETSQYYYYWNTVTNEVTWEIPTEYTQFLLLQREYQERIAKYSAEQLQRLKEKQASKYSKVNGTGSTGALTHSAVEAQSSKNLDTQVSTSKQESLPVSISSSSSHSRHKHEKKKKSHKSKKHKHRRNEGYSSDEGGKGRHSPHMPDIGPPEGPTAPPAVIGPSLPSIVPYLSDQEDDDNEDEEDNGVKSMPELGGPEVDSRKSSPSDSGKVEKEEVEPSMPVLGSVSEVREDPEDMAQGEQLVKEKDAGGTDDDGENDDHSAPDLPPELLAEVGVKEPDVTASAGEEANDVSNQAQCVAVTEDGDSDQSEGFAAPSSSSVSLLPKDESSSSEIKVEESGPPLPNVESCEEGLSAAVLPKQDAEGKCQEDDVKLEQVTTSSADSSEKDRTKKSRKKKEELDMFAEDFPSIVSPKPALSDDEAVATAKLEVKSVELEKDAKDAVKMESMEEGEISEGLENVSSVEKEKAAAKVVSNSSLPKQEKLSSRKSDKPKDKPMASSSGGNKSSKSFSIVASYGGTDEEEEGELKESDGERSKRRKKEKKKESKKRKLDVKAEKPSVDLEKIVKPPSEHQEIVEEKKLKEKGKEEVPCPEQQSGSGNDMALVTEDIDPDDLDDIDRALELALEKKLERKKVELQTHDVASVDVKLANGNGAQLVTETAKDVDSKGDGDSKTGAEAEEENLKTEIKEMAELALNKLEFLDIGTDNLSRLQILFIELQTRLTDWGAGGLSSQYFRQQLVVAEGLLQQYELSAVPEGWACQWDRANNRYYYRHKVTGRIQWEYPEVKDDKEEVKEKESGRKASTNENRSRDASEVEDRKSRSSSGRHRKREEKERSKYDKHSSSHRHRRKRRRRRDHSSSSEGSAADATATPRRQHKSKRKKRQRSEVRSPSVEILDDPDVLEVRDGSGSPQAGSSRASPLPPDLTASGLELGVSPLPSPPPIPAPPHSEEGENPPELQLETTGSEVKDPEADAGLGDGIDGEAMEEEGGEKKEEKEAEEENSAVISRPPQIIIPPHVVAMQPPELYSAPPLPSAPAVTSQPGASTTETNPSQQEADAEKQIKKKKKEKKSSAAGSSGMMKKKHMSSMVQKWQRVKKEVEKEDRDKELRQAAIRQKIQELK